jgi:hypothetical protein
MNVIGFLIWLVLAIFILLDALEERKRGETTWENELKKRKH